MIPPQLQGALWHKGRDRTVMVAQPRWEGMAKRFSLQIPVDDPSVPLDSKRSCSRDLRAAGGMAGMREVLE